MKNKLFLKALVLVFFLGVCLIIFSPKKQAFTLVSSTPTDKSRLANPDGVLELTFSNSIDPSKPYDSFSISPRIDGKVTVEDEKIIFTPRTAYNDSTSYRVTIKQLRSISGTVIDIPNFTFTTTARKLTSFEETLPYDGGDFTIDRLSNGTIIITVVNPPIAQSKERAYGFLRSKNMDTRDVHVEIAASAQ